MITLPPLFSLPTLTILIPTLLFTTLIYIVPRLFHHHQHNPSNSTPWAFITGSSSGIGHGIAHHLLTQNFNVILHGRDQVRLTAAVDSLRTLFPTRKITSICFDVTTCLTDTNLKPEILELLAPLVATDTDSDGNKDDEKINLRLLVNNIGTSFNPHSPSDFAPLTTQSPSHITQNIDVNVRFTTYLTYFLLPTLKRNALSSSSPSGSSTILNISSLASLGLPYITVYSAAKAYLTTFSKALDTELKAENWPVEVKVVECGDVDTPGHRVGRGLFTPDGIEMGRMIVRAVGRSRRGEVVVWPFWGHWVQRVACMVQPWWMLQVGLILGVKRVVSSRKTEDHEDKERKGK